MITFRVTIIATVVGLAGLGTCFGQDGTRMARGLFYTDTSYGNLAWIPTATTAAEDIAAGGKFVRDLSGKQCFTFPKRDTYWFLLNHRSPEDVNLAGFFAVEIVGQSPKAGETYFSLRRNENWTSYDGESLPDEANAQPPQLTMPIDTFIDLHDDSKKETSTDEQRRGTINKAMNDVWHAKPDSRRLGTWDYRDLFASRDHLVDPREKSNQLSARLIHFTITNKKVSPEPVIFLVYRNGAGVFWVRVAGPGLPRPRETEIRIGSDCP